MKPARSRTTLASTRLPISALTLTLTMNDADFDTPVRGYTCQELGAGATNLYL